MLLNGYILSPNVFMALDSQEYSSIFGFLGGTFKNSICFCVLLYIVIDKINEGYFIDKNKIQIETILFWISNINEDKIIRKLTGMNTGVWTDWCGSWRTPALALDVEHWAKISYEKHFCATFSHAIFIIFDSQFYGCR